MNKQRGILYAFLAVILYATIGFGFKIAVTNVNPFIATVYIGLFATLFLGVYLAIKGKLKDVIKEFKKNKLFFIIAGFIGLGLQQILYLKSFSLLPASNVVILFYLYPIFMIFISGLFFKHKISIKSILLLFIGFIGVYILISKGSLIIPILSLGTILAILASLSWAFFSVLIKYKKFEVESGMFLFNLFGLISLLLMIPWFGFDFKISTTAIIGLVYLGIFPTAIAFLFWNKALKSTNLSTCSNIALLTPLLSILLISIILGEKLVPTLIVSLVLIVGSVYLNLRFEKNK